MKNRFFKFVGIAIAIAAPMAVYAAYSGPTATPTGNNTAGPVWLQTTTPQTGGFNISSDGKIGGDFYYLTSGKAMRVDGVGSTALNVSNYNGSATGFTMNLTGDLTIGGGALTATTGTLRVPTICLNGTCRNSWPAVGGGGTITGGGTTNYVPLFTPSGTALGNSGIAQSGTNVGVQTAAPSAQFEVGTNALFSGIDRVRILGYSNSGGASANLEIGDGGGVYWRFLRNAANAFEMNLSSSLGIMGGNVGMGTITPGAKLTIVGSTTEPGTADDGLGLFVSKNTGGANASIAEFRHDNLSQGVGIGYASVFASGANANQGLEIFSRGTSPLVLNASGGGNVGIKTVDPSMPGTYDTLALARGAGGIYGLTTNVTGQWYMSLATEGANRLSVMDNGNVGIGTTGPAYKLDVNGDIAGNWLRTRGNTGWYSETYGGGWYMTDASWIRTYGGKNTWTAGGLMGSDGGLTVGYGGATPPAGGGIIAGTVGIGTSNPTNGKLEVQTAGGNAIYGYTPGGSGVRGVSAAGWGVYGIAQNSGDGVHGVNQSSGGNGVYGEATAGIANANGVRGDTNGPSGSGVMGYNSTAASGQGVMGTGYTGVLGNGALYGVYGSGAYGVYGSGSGQGVYGTGPYGVIGNGSLQGIVGQGGSVGGNFTGSSYGAIASGGSYSFYGSAGTMYNAGNLQLGGMVTCIQGNCPANGAIRLTPNLHLNSGAGNAVIVNWDNGTSGGAQTFRIGNGAGSDVFYVLGNGETHADGRVYTGSTAGMGTNYVGPGRNGDMSFINNTGSSWTRISGTGGLAFWSIGGGDSNDSPQMFLDTGGSLNTTAGYTQGSDRDLKKDIAKLKKYGIDDIMKLEPVTFEYKIDPSTPQLGFIAQDMQKVMPEFVSGKAISEGGSGLSVNYASMVSVLTKGMQDQQHEIDALKVQNADLMKRLEALEAKVK